MACRRRSGFGHEADQNAIEFLGVCSSVVAPSCPQCPSPAPPSARPASLVVHIQTYAGADVVKSVVLLCVVYPTVYVCILLPLFAFDLGFELWSAYFFGCSNAAALWFASEIRLAAFGRRPTLRLMAFAWAAFTAVIVVCFMSAGCMRGGRALGLWGGVFGVCSCIYFPSAHGLLLAARRGEMVLEAMWFIVGMSLGAMPCAIAVVALVYVREYGLINNLASLVACVIIWTILPWPFKLAGKEVWQRASPKCRAFGPVLFIYYVDYAFNCLGVCIFSFSMSGVLAHAMGFAATLVLHYFRGTERAYSLLPNMGTISLHRTMILMEAFAALLGRLAAYTSFLCFGSCNMVFDEDEPTAMRPTTMRSILGRTVITSFSVSLYRGYNIDAVSLMGAVLAGALVSCVFVVFCQVLPHVWTVSFERIHPEGDEAAGMRHHRVMDGAEDVVIHISTAGGLDDVVRRINRCQSYGPDDAVIHISTAGGPDDVVRRVNRCQSHGPDDAVTHVSTMDGSDAAVAHIVTVDGADDAVTHIGTMDKSDGSAARASAGPQGEGRQAPKTETDRGAEVQAGSLPRAQPDIESVSTTTLESEASSASAGAAGPQGLEGIMTSRRSWTCDVQLAVAGAGVRQDDILLGFMRTYWRYLISMSVFVNALNLILLNAAEAIMLGFTNSNYCHT